MLSSPRPQPRRARQQSLRQEYEEFILQRIEEYKDRLSRQDLMGIADEAVRELEVGSEEQLVLTEVLVLEHVDRLIRRRLRLPSFRRWRDQHLKLRQAQCEPGYWGLHRETVLTELALRLDETDAALLVGGGATAPGLFLAAHGWPTLLMDSSLTTVEAAERRAASEGLAARFQALVVSLGSWFPDITPSLVVFDQSTVNALEAPTRNQLIDTLKALTKSGGVHHVQLLHQRHNATSLSDDILRNHYGDWSLSRSGQNRRRREFMAVKP
ncbi:MAG: hypothetical protein JSW71_10840 [Gemmatimonadota bacterium]|nr:MAG: hypothetical protein JSW71_10840 [Gemmatimonadota bacterium]